MQEVYIRLGRAIAKKRRAARLSQKRFGEILGKSREWVAGIEQGRTRILLHDFLELEMALRIRGDRGVEKEIRDFYFVDKELDHLQPEEITYNYNNSHDGRPGVVDIVVKFRSAQYHLLMQSELPRVMLHGRPYDLVVVNVQVEFPATTITAHLLWRR